MIAFAEKCAGPVRIEVRANVWLDSRLALWIQDIRLLVVADLHWGYAASHRVQGNLLPAWGDGEIAARLKALAMDYQPAEMIWLGDSLHTLHGSDAAEDFLHTARCDVTVISGNHDARWKRANNRAFVSRGGYFLHHGDKDHAVPREALEIVGHFHPAVSWHDGAGTRLKLPALVAGTRRLVLPAFSPWAGGVPWKSPAEGERLYAISTKRIFTVPLTASHKEPLAK
jgi:metallophosphoesterase superfamily enzyme